VHGDSVDTFYDQQKKVAGADDARLYELLPDVLHWLGVTQIDKFFSRSAAKVHLDDPLLRRTSPPRPLMACLMACLNAPQHRGTPSNLP
jgi:hypothetical protein